MISDILKAVAEAYPQILASVMVMVVIPLVGSFIFTRAVKGFYVCTKDQVYAFLFQFAMMTLVLTWIIVNADFVPDWTIAIVVVMELAGIWIGRWVQRAYQKLGYVEFLR